MIMVVKKTFRLTKEGIAELQQELDSLTLERAEIAESIRTAREFGDLAENSEYQSARAAQERNESRIAEIEYVPDFRSFDSLQCLFIKSQLI